MTGYPSFRVSIPCVLVGIRGYPFLLAPQGCKSHPRKAVCWVFVGIRRYPLVLVVGWLLGFPGYSGLSGLFVVKSCAYDRASFRCSLNSLRFRWYLGYHHHPLGHQKWGGTSGNVIYIFLGVDLRKCNLHYSGSINSMVLGGPPQKNVRSDLEGHKLHFLTTPPLPPSFYNFKKITSLPLQGSESRGT